VPLDPANGRESCFAAARTCHSQDMREACMGRPICVRRGGQNRQPRHRTPEGVIELGFEVVIVCLLCGSVLGMVLLVSVVVGLRRKGNIRSLHQALFSDRAYGFEV